VSAQQESLGALASSARSYARLARQKWRDRQLAAGESGWGVPAPPPAVLPVERTPARVAIVGAGVQGRMMAKGVLAVTGAELAGMADLDAERLATAGQQHGLAAADQHLDAAEMFETLRPDVAIIATTAPSHAALARLALEAGTERVLVEKPIDVSCAAAAELAELADRRGAYLAVGYTRRWMPDHRSVAEAIRAGQIGEPRLLTASLGAGQLAMHASHLVDLARMLLDSEVTEVTARLRPSSTENVRGTEFDDPTGHLFLRFASGARAHVDFEEDLSRGYGAILVRGEEGSILIEETLDEWTLRGRSRRTWTFPFAARFEPTTMATRTVLGVLSEDEPSCTAHDGLAALDVILAAHHSSRAGGAPVPLPLTEAQRSLQVRFP
jgi:predicted dehydrogenase